MILWAEIEPELVAVVEEDPETMLPLVEEAPEEALMRRGNARVALLRTSDRQIVVCEAEIEDPMPLQSAAMESAAGSSSRAVGEDMSLLEDDLLDAKYGLLQLESFHHSGDFKKVTSKYSVLIK